MSEGRSAYARADLEWYQEPPWVSERLLDAERFDGGAHDPACGVGTIPDVLASRGLPFSGADIVDRARREIRLARFLDSDSLAGLAEHHLQPAGLEADSVCRAGARPGRARRPGGGARAAQMGGLARSLRPVFPPRDGADGHSSRRPSMPARRSSASQGRGHPQGRFNRFRLVPVARRQGSCRRPCRVAQVKQFGARSGRAPKRQRKPWTAARKAKRCTIMSER